MNDKRASSLICFTGIDGSGKTTLAKKVCHDLEERNIPAVYVHARFRLILSKPIVFLGNQLFLRKVKTADYMSSSNKKKSLFQKHGLATSLYLYLLIIDYLMQVIIEVKLPLLFRKVVLCDRYIFDTVLTDMAVDMGLSEDQCWSLIDKCFMFIPRPALAFMVDVREDVAFKRKNDIPSIEYIEDRRSKYMKLSKHYSMELLDGNESPEKVFHSCIRRLNDLFIS